MPQVEFEGAATAFVVDERSARLARLWGVEAAAGGPPRVQGLALVQTDRGRIEGDAWTLTGHETAAEFVRFTWRAADVSLRLDSEWRLDAANATWSRRDAITNEGSEPVTLTRCLARFPFAPAGYEVYTQGSVWCGENQGRWQTVDHGTLVFGCAGGRTTQGGTPYLCLRAADTIAADVTGVAFHILPVGNWTFRVSSHATGIAAVPAVVVEAGLADNTLRLALTPGQQLDLPEILIQAVPHGAPELAAPAFHAYALAHQLASAKPHAPVIYNTWFDAFEMLDVARLRGQLAAAREAGCEVFVVDAGWYGASAGNWGLQVGDWREKPDRAFRGHMADFADEVRAAGLGFGLWMEPERNHPTVPAVQAHPGWFLPGADGFIYPDLAQSAAYDYILGEMARLVETYRLAWMKVDFNFELGRDATELSAYYAAWYRLLDTLRSRYPATFFEGCASGGMRSDLHTVSHFDGHFLSDTTDPVDVLRITQGGLLRLPPGRMGKWACLRSAGQTVISYGSNPEQPPETILIPWNATWETSFSASLDFALLTALPGMFGLSGDLAGLSADARSRVAHWVAFYKEWRDFITGSVAHLLTPIAPRPDRQGWVAFQLQEPAGDRSLLCAYRLDRTEPRHAFRLRGLDPAREYRVVDGGRATEDERRRTGRELMERGLTVELPVFGAAVYSIL